MYKVVAVLALVALSHALNVEEEWSSFKSRFSKSYDSQVEEASRREIFETHLRYIQGHNEAYRRGDETFFLAVNEYADLKNEEFVAKMNHFKPRSTPSTAPVYGAANLRDLPDTVDWRTKGYVTGVKNQGQCGSCWAFSTTGSLEGQWFKKTGKLVSLSEQNLVDCSKKQGNHGCEGGLMDYGFEYIKANKGIDTEESYPYRGVDGTCKFNAANVGANLTSYTDVKKEDEGALQTAVANVGPISVAIDASHISFQLYAGGVYHSYFCSQTKLDHGVLAVGYGKYENKDYWLVKNSWGTSWGLKGYIMMSRNRHNNCGIATSASYPVV